MSKKKGVKLDWNVLARDSNQDMALPSAPGQPSSYNGRQDNRQSWERQGQDRQRPKLNLTPRTVPVDPRPGEQVNPPSAPVSSSNDKWDNVFAKKASNDVRKQPLEEEFVEAPRSSRSGRRDVSAELSEAIQNAVISTENVKKVDPKKAAKAAARAEEEKKRQQEKEAALAAKEAKMQAEKDAREKASKLSQDIIATGIKGDDLVKHIEGLEIKPEPASMVSILLAQITDPTVNAANACRWCTKSEYGQALATLNKGNAMKQLFCLYEVQKYCDGLKFPKIEVKGEKLNLIEVMFQVMYTNEVVDNDGFGLWSDDDNDEIPGKLNAVVQTTNFISMLNEVDEDEENEEVEDDEVDAVRETI